MHVLERLAVRHRLSTGQTPTPAMYRGFSDFVYSIGNVPEMGFMTWYYFLARTNPLRALKMMPLALSLFTHGRMSFKARRLKPEAEQQLKAILDRAEVLGGMS